MREKLYPLQVIDIHDVHIKTEARHHALHGQYKGLGRGDSIGIGMMPGILGLFSSFGIAARMFGIPASNPFLAILMAFSFVIIPTAACFTFLEIRRRRGIKRVLQDAEMRYYYQLEEAVCAYNEQADNYNRFLTAGQENMTMVAESVMCRFQEALRPIGEDLQKLIGESSDRDEFPCLSLEEINKKRTELERTREDCPVLPPSGNPDFLPKQLPEVSANYSEALAELDAEFTGDKD